jgi:drug/metabolite transporter (DMT)-like permease
MNNINSSKNDQLFLMGMIASMTCWGLSWASGKVLAGYGSPLTIALYRFSVTFISLLFILICLRQKLTILRSGLKDLLIASIFISLYFYLFFKALSLGKAGAGGVLVTVLNPIVSYGFMLAMMKRRPSKNETIGLTIGIVAGVILLQLWSQWNNLFGAGTIYFLLASFTWAVLSIFTSRSSKYGSPVVFSLWMYGICSIVMMVISNTSENIHLFQTGDKFFWWNMFFSATITTAMATTFYFVATSKLGASKASSFIFLVPFSAAIGSWIFLNEEPQLHTIVGGLLGVAAVYILNKKSTSEKAL